MSSQSIPPQWQQESEAVLSGVAEWRLQHPQASWREIEQAIDERLGRLRSKLLQETAQQSQQRTWSQHEEGAPAPQCPTCHLALQARGSHSRTLHSSAGTQITLQRTYGTCPRCGSGFFPPG
jgi:hypothetical protein